MSRNLRLDEAVEFAENPEPRCPCVLLLDTSGSMQGEPLWALQQGLQVLKFDLMVDDLAKKRVELAVISFDSRVTVLHDFMTVDQFTPPQLFANGATLMGAGLHQALDLIQERKQQYRSYGISYYRPWVFLITDGEPQGETPEEVERAVQRLRNEEDAKRVALFAVGVEGANMPKLRSLFTRTPLKLKGLNFRELFLWLSASMQRVSQSRIDDQVPLPPADWGML